ncbi:formate hydrogenase HycE [Pseudonocardia sulfidoxydans NBRC 16205]|uniref:Formate hydrogenase HycE n=1 Tax=Pseudonocardia sulfidoxydans NBRC 16205 TaxID=1223511 RepID=A0A511DHI4_9PSEU|nr:NADH-quinone oxidoreductase subunit C [Pseudonocardia sulfidoxydans]GEL24256.1 formate hydrogenase HycE [Pseudonocardia sulfidoxydans NBRC 16205]
MTSNSAHTGPRRVVSTVAADALPDRAAALLAGGARLALVAGHDDRPSGGGLRTVHLFVEPGTDVRTELHVHLDPDAPSIPSLAALSFPAGRFERELRDLFGIEPVGHPLPRRLVRHFHWPRGWYPMLSDAGPAPAFGDPDGPYPFRPVDGPGVYEIPVGPVHAGMIEPGHFRFSVVGETILKLKARLWFVHRGLEKLVEGRSPAEALEIAQRVSGDTTVGHGVAFCQAVEDALGIDVDPQARRLRAVLLELERLYNHVNDLGALCNDVGHGILNAHAQRVRERLLRLNEQVTGHRLLRGAVVAGGAAVARLPDPTVLAEAAADVAEIADLALGHSVVHDRFAGTAILTRDQATELGTLGYVARASGLDVDARHDHPVLPGELPRAVHTRTEGDVLARFQVRREEIDVAVATIAALVEHIHGPAHRTDPRGRRGAERSGVGITEGWRGTIVHRVELGGDGAVRRLKIVDPSFFNWPALPVALADTIVPDFPLVNKSFNLSYAGNDL